MSTASTVGDTGDDTECWEVSEASATNTSNRVRRPESKGLEGTVQCTVARTASRAGTLSRVAIHSTVSSTTRVGWGASGVEAASTTEADDSPASSASVDEKATEVPGESPANRTLGSSSPDTRGRTKAKDPVGTSGATEPEGCLEAHSTSQSKGIES